MKKILLTEIFLLFTAFHSFSQSYDWIKGGGCTDVMSPSMNYDQVDHMCTDANGNVYVTSVVGATGILADTFYRAIAFNPSHSYPHILLTSYRCDGTMRWAKLIESNGYANSGGIEYSNGSVFVAGALVGNNKHIGYDTVIASSYLQSFTARFDTSGGFKWVRFIGPDIYSTELRTAGSPGVLAIDGNGYIHNFSFIENGVQIFLTDTTTRGTYDLTYDFTGNLISATRIAALDSIWALTKVVFNKTDNKYFATIQPYSNYWYSVYSNWNSAVCAFQPNGNLIWMDTTGANGGIVGIDYKGGNQIYVCGQGNPDPFSLGGISVADILFPGYAYATIFRLDTNGVAHWVYNLQSNESVDVLTAVTVLPNGHIASTGGMTGTSIHGFDTTTSTSGEQTNPFFVIIDSSGNTVKLDQLHGSGNDDFGYAITSDAVGNIYMGGELEISIAATGVAPYNTHGGNTDFFVAKYGYNCSCTIAPVASFSYTGGTTVSFTYTGTPGFDSLKWDFGDGGTSTVTNPVHAYFSTGIHHVCVTIYTSCGIVTHCMYIGATTGVENAILAHNALVYPNPATDELIIENATQGTQVRLFNIVGQQVYNDIISNDKQAINMKYLVAGAYLLQLTDNNGNRTTKTIIKQ